MLPVGPVGHEQAVGDQDPGRHLMGLKHPDRFPGLHEHGLIVFEGAQRSADRVEAGPIARGLAASAVDDEFIRVFRDRRIEVVHQRP